MTRPLTPRYAVLIGLVVTGCASPGGDGSRRRAPTDTDTPPAATGTGTGTTAPGTGTGSLTETDTGPLITDPSVSLASAGVVTCAAPAARDAVRFRGQPLSDLNTGGRNLTSAGMVVADFDGDGLMEWFAPSYDGFRFLERQPDGSWVDIASERLADPDLDHVDTVGASTADYDGDGDLDLFVTGWERHDLLLRNDDGVFTDVTELAGVGGADDAPSLSASWGDYDGDGDLDLAVGVYGSYILDGFDPDPSFLYRNEGDGTFSDQSALLPPEVHGGYNFINAWQDIDGDLRPELLVLNDHDWGQPTILVKYGSGRFWIDRASRYHPGIASMGLGLGDVNDDLVPDMVESTFRDVSLMKSHPALEAPNGVQYIEYADAEGMVHEVEERHQIFGWGTELADIDNDGDLDAPMLFGFWDMHPKTDASQPGLDPRDQHDALFLKDGTGYTDVAGLPEWQVDDIGSGRGLLAVDVNGDGWLDLVKRLLDDHDVVYEGVCGADSWLEVALRAPAPNTHAVGARVLVEAGGRRQVRWVGSGNTSMFSGGPPVVHFGLGSAQVIDRLEITWPQDRKKHTFTGVSGRQAVTITRAW